MRVSTSAALSLALGALFLPLGAAAAQSQERAAGREPVLLDTDLGSDMGDAFALALILASPELELRGVTVVGGDTQVRALMACRFLTMTGRRHVAVAAGAAPPPEHAISATGQYRYYYHPDVLFNRTTRPAKESAVDFLYARLKAQPGKVTLLATGPLTNVARLLAEKPECKPWIRRIVLTEGAPVKCAPVGSNFTADPKAARAVLAAGVPLVVMPVELTADLRLDEDDLRRVFSAGTALTLNLQALHQMWDGGAPVFADPLAVALCLNEGFCEFEELRVEVDDAGRMRRGEGKPNARVATRVDRRRFTEWYVGRLESCVAPAQRSAKVIAPGGMPNRVHVAEDYDNDVERFWWMSGKPETKDVPPGSRRACRGVLTHDFDDLLGNTKAMYTGVVFNPVPGPPMGKNTRLAFRYKLKGTGELRVQIYSLTNGYHRHLILKGLPQVRWESAAVDLTQARRPDGTGGPLSEHERIDDVQFYADPAAELLIDDVVLYDAAAPGEKRPFPKHVHWSAGFDTGQQGKHWPGTFEVVSDKGAFWRAARSVPNTDLGAPWLRVQLRGERPFGAATRVSFRYRLTGADRLRMVLLRGQEKVGETELKGLRQGEWAEAAVDRAALGDAAGAGKAGTIDEVQFLLPRGAELLLDDLLLYEPG